MSLFKLEQMYKSGQLSKKEYISRMYAENHDILFEYSEFIKDRDISRIEITDGTVIIETRELGIKMICNRYDEGIVPLVMLTMGDYEKKELNMFFKLVNDGDVIFDIGSNIGWFSIALYKAKKNIEIHAFEPIPSTYKTLLANAKINGAKIKINNFGLSDKTQNLTFYCYKECSANASMKIMNEEKENIAITCFVDTIDNYVKQQKIKKLDFIKCDVEGAELFVFKGGLDTFKKFRPIVFAEMLRKWSAKFGYHPNDIIEFFKHLGYKCYFINNNKLKEIKVMTEETEETNFFFLHTEKHLQIITELVDK